MPALPADFIFSQASLQDYVECRRRFQLRYLLALAWPAVAAEPADEYEAHLSQGETFHRLIHQHQLALATERLAEMVAAADQEAEGAAQLGVWWQNYLAAGPTDLPGQRYPELALSAPVGSHRLLAKYDLIAIEPGRQAVIVDWKTSQHRPKRAWLAARLQTRVYRYVLAEAGGHLNPRPEALPDLTAPRPAATASLGCGIQPDQITMRYWFANFPDQPELLPYDATQHAADRKYLAGLIAEIAGAGEDDFSLTDDATRCRYCAYRSLCGRGVAAAEMSQPAAEDAPEPQTDDWAASFDFEQVAEVVF